MSQQEYNQILMQFGPIHGNVEKQEIRTVPQSEDSQTGVIQEVSPVFLNKNRGYKIDLIRVLNTLYELGFFTDDKGGRISKKEVMIAIGRSMNLDLSNYDNDLSRSLSDSTAEEKHLSIFKRMLNKMQEIFNMH